MFDERIDLLAPTGDIVSRIKGWFPDLFSIYAFGSQVQGTAGPESDLDLAILVPGYVSPQLLWEHSGRLADLAGCPVDLIDLRAASTVMQYQIITTGRVLWSIGLNAGLFESYVLSEKLKLDVARGGLLADIAREGRVYAR